MDTKYVSYFAVLKNMLHFPLRLSFSFFIGRAGDRAWRGEGLGRGERGGEVGGGDTRKEGGGREADGEVFIS